MFRFDVSAGCLRVSKIHQTHDHECWDHQNIHRVCKGIVLENLILFVTIKQQTLIIYEQADI